MQEEHLVHLKQNAGIYNDSALWAISQQQPASHPCISCTFGATTACSLQGRLQDSPPWELGAWTGQHTNRLCHHNPAQFIKHQQEIRKNS